MEELLQRLLDAEARAEAIIAEAGRQRERLLAEAMQQARALEAEFETRRAQIRAPILREAEARADQMIAELTRKFEERSRELRMLAARHEPQAQAAALQLMLDPRL